MSSKVTFHLFGKPFIIFVLGALFALIFGRITPTGDIIDESYYPVHQSNYISADEYDKPCLVYTQWLFIPIQPEGTGIVIV